MSKQSKFVDQARILVKGGNGGDGHVGFRRAKYVPKGGPDGGDGGNGGDVFLVGTPHLSTLMDFQFKRHFRAKPGEKGGRNQRTGASGASVEQAVPLGTIVLEDDGTPLTEITKEGEKFIVGKGGKGGLGNTHFKSSTNRAPLQATEGEKREDRWVRLELRLLADVGIVGPPNAGKSTLLSVLTAAKPKIGDYPFTTLSPSLGVMFEGDRIITLADVPGLIEGAHQGAGLGIEFLRHIARTRVLLYLIPLGDTTPSKLWKQFEVIQREIHEYDAKLAKRPFLVALNKTDLATKTEIQKSVDYFEAREISPLTISAKKKLDLDTLRKKLKSELR